MTIILTDIHYLCYSIGQVIASFINNYHRQAYHIYDLGKLEFNKNSFSTLIGILRNVFTNCLKVNVKLIILTMSKLLNLNMETITL